MGTDYNCGCRRSLDRWYLCEKHETALLNAIEMAELNKENTISDVVRNGKGNIKKFVNERKMKGAK